jgi:hypothetical protein
VSFHTPHLMRKTSLLLSLVLALATLNSCTTVQDENDAALDASMDEQAQLENDLALDEAMDEQAALERSLSRSR